MEKAGTVNRYVKQEETKHVSLMKMSRKNTRAVAVGSRVRLWKPNTKLVLNDFEVRNHCFVSNLTNPVNKMSMRLIYLKNSTVHHCHTRLSPRLPLFCS